MNKSTINILLHVVVAVAIVLAFLPALRSGDDGYSGAVAVKTVVVEEVAAEPEPEPEPEVVVDTVVPVVEDVAPELMVDTIVAEPQAAVTEVSNPAENENKAALYSVVDGNKLDANSYAGFKLFRNWCARCHGTYGQGMVGPNLADSLKIISEKQFFDTVENGKTGQIGSMPTWRKNVKVMAGRDQLYAYLMARSDGAIGVEKPKKQ